MIQEAMRSPFLLQKIKTTPWEKRKVVQDILLLYRLMVKQKLSPAEGQLYFLLRKKYEDAYVNLLRETNSIQYQIYLEDREKLQQQQANKNVERERQQQLVEQERKEYEAWMAFQERA